MHSSNSLGSQLYTVFPFTISGFPALGFAESGISAYFDSFFSEPIMSFGPTEQLRPNTSAPMDCMTTRAASTSPPVSVFPFSSHVNETITGLLLLFLTAVIAALASDKVIIVSMTKRSTPACSRPSTCSSYASTRSSKVADPRGVTNSPVGAMSPATRALSPAASLDRHANLLLYSVVLLKILFSSSFTLLPPNVGV